MRALRPYLGALAREVQEVLFRRLPQIISDFDAKRPGVKRDAADEDIADIMGQIRTAFSREFTAAEIKRIAERRGITIANLNKEFLSRGVKSVLGVDVFAGEPYLADQIGMFATHNAQLITSMGEEYLGKVENLTYQGLQNGLRASEIERNILGQIDPSVGNIRARAELIARDQVSKLNGQLTNLRQTELGVERYVWRSVGDERVRDWHRELNGQTFSWDEPPITNYRGDRNHPGGDFQCRCWAEPVLSDLIEGIDDEEEDPGN